MTEGRCLTLVRFFIEVLLTHTPKEAITSSRPKHLGEREIGRIRAPNPGEVEEAYSRAGTI